MHARVTAILVARNGADFLERTLGALASQTRRPDSTILVDAGSTDDSTMLLAAAAPSQLISVPSSVSFGAAVRHTLRVIEPPESDDDWMWLLAHDNAPEPRALQSLLAAVEVAPSVAVAGPKLMRWDSPDVIAEFGETVSPFGTTMTLVERELDQAQHDTRSDILAVASAGMLVRRSVWDALGGFDPGLPTIDASLDFCIRARLAGHRVVGVAGSRVLSSGGPELFGRTAVSAASLARQRRSAQLRRRLTYAPTALVPLHWLTLLPLALIRSLGHLLAKRPGAVLGEFVAAVVSAFAPGLPSARRTIAGNRRVSWRALAPLRMSWGDVWQHRAHARDADRSAHAGPWRERVSFFSGGGAWIVVFAAVASAIVWSTLLNAGSVAGGGILPLSATPAELWANVGYGWRGVGTGIIAPADPFAWVLAVLGSVTFWSPSQAIVGVYLLSLPLAALGAWFCAARFSVRPWAPAVAAILWAIAPMFLASLEAGQLGAAIAHVTLPWLVLATVRATRSWSSSATASILFALVAASSPILIPALVVAWFAWVLARPMSAHRLLGIPIPMVALFAPIAVYQFAAGNPVAVFATPGAPTTGDVTAGTQLVIGSAGDAYNGWIRLAQVFGVPMDSAAAVAVTALIPLALAAIASVFLPGALRAIPALFLALLGLATAVVAVHLEVTAVGSDAVPIWPGAALSLYWCGLVGAAAAAIEAARRVALVPAMTLIAAALVVSLPLLVAPARGATDVHEGTGRILPAFVTAEAAAAPWLGTLEIIPQEDGSIRALVHRGIGTTLDDHSTAYASRSQLTSDERRVARLAGNLSSRSGLDAAPELAALDIAFVVLSGDRDTLGEGAERTFQALDGNSLLTPVGITSQGFLWHYQDLASDVPVTFGPGPAGTATGVLVLTLEAVVFGAAFLLAIPTRRRIRVKSRRPDAGRSETGLRESVGENSLTGSGVGANRG